MPRASKIPRYEDYNKRENCFGEYARPLGELFKYLDKSKPLVLELGCGKAELGLGLAERNVKTNYVCIDKKADRLQRAAHNAEQRNLKNIVFAQLDIASIADFFEAESVALIWITFPDPFPKKRQIKHRMTTPKFLEQYHKILTENGMIRFKTDNKNFFDWSLMQFINTNYFNLSNLSYDLHGDKDIDQDAKIITSFEARYIKLGTTINYLQAVKNS